MSVPVVLSLGSNLGDRLVNLRRGVEKLSGAVRVVRVSSLFETEPLDATPGSGPFLNAIVAGVTPRTPVELLEAILEAERSMGRVRRLRNEPRQIDIDIILYDSRLLRSGRLTLPHPRYRERNFVLDPLKELRLGWVDPSSGMRIDALQGRGSARRVRALY